MWSRGELLHPPVFMVFAVKNVIQSCTMLQSVRCLFHAKYCRLSDRENSGVLLRHYSSCYVSLTQAAVKNS